MSVNTSVLQGKWWKMVENKLHSELLNVLKKRPRFGCRIMQASTSTAISDF